MTCYGGNGRSLPCASRLLTEKPTLQDQEGKSAQFPQHRLKYRVQPDFGNILSLHITGMSTEFNKDC